MAMDMSGWTVGALLQRQAEQAPQRCFLELADGGTLSYGETWQRARRTAEVLRREGVGAGDTVAILLPGGSDAVIAWLAANLLGAVDVTLNNGYRGASLEHALNQSQARCLIVGAQYLPQLLASEPQLSFLKRCLVVGPAPAQPAAQLHIGDYAQALQAVGDDHSAWPPLPVVKASDIASVVYTSGTAGPAKGVQMPHGQVVLIARQTVRKQGLGPQDILYSFYPPYHMAGKFCQLLAAIDAGAKVVLDSVFDPARWLQRVRDSGATVSGAHGPMLEMIYAQPPTSADRDHRLRLLCCAPLPQHIAAAFEQRFGVRGIEVWGMTEIGIPLWCPADQPLRPGSCGRVDDEWFEFRIVDPETHLPLPPGQTGEFVVRPRQPWTISTGYMGMPEQTVAAWRNLWFHSGDEGRMDADGWVYFTDRGADRIRRRAENIAAHDIEIAALAHAGVAEAAAVGTPSEFAGDDDIRLFVVPKPGQAVEPEALLRHLAQRLPHFMVPRYLESIDTLPRSVTQKLQRAALRQQAFGPRSWDRKAHGIELRSLMTS